LKIELVKNDSLNDKLKEDLNKQGTSDQLKTGSDDIVQDEFVDSFESEEKENDNVASIANVEYRTFQK
jgi:hypothetical protein